MKSIFLIVTILLVGIMGCQSNQDDLQSKAITDSISIDPIPTRKNMNILNLNLYVNDSSKISAIDSFVFKLNQDTALILKKVCDYEIVEPDTSLHQIHPILSYDKIVAGTDNTERLIGYYADEYLVKIFHSSVKPSDNHGFIEVFTSLYFNDQNLIVVEEIGFIKEPPMGRPSCFSQSLRVHYFENGEVFQKKLGTTIGGLPNRSGPYGANKNERCWSLSKEDEDQHVLELLEYCLGKLGEEHLLTINKTH